MTHSLWRKSVLFTRASPVGERLGDPLSQFCPPSITALSLPQKFPENNMENNSILLKILPPLLRKTLFTRNPDGDYPIRSEKHLLDKNHFYMYLDKLPIMFTPILRPMYLDRLFTHILTWRIIHWIEMSWKSHE